VRDLAMNANALNISHFLTLNIQHQLWILLTACSFKFPQSLLVMAGQINSPMKSLETT